MAGQTHISTRNTLFNKGSLRGDTTFLAVKELASPERSGIPEAQRKDKAENGNQL
jgi:hypothetical protein